MAGNVICSKCGQENDAELTFCGSCGAFLEWSGQKVEGDPAVSTPASAGPGDGELAGLARPRSTTPVQPPPVLTTPDQPASAQPLEVAPVRPGPSVRSVPPTPAESAVFVTASDPVPAAIVPDPTIACPSCARANPLDRTFCHSCGVLLRPRPPDPAGPRRRGRAGSPADGRAALYRFVSLLLLIAIILVGSFVLTRLTAHSSAPTPLPSAAGASAGPLTAVGRGALPAGRWSVAG
jgi:hypothetical protein